MAHVIRGTPLIPGTVTARAAVSTEPLSFWGGYDAQSGEIIDRRHPLTGVRVAGRVLAVPLTRGSSTTTAILLEAIQAGTAPAAILTTGIDAFLVLASVVAGELYGRSIPIVSLTEDDFRTLSCDSTVAITADGTVTVST